MKYFHKKKQEKDTSFIKSMPQSAQNDTYNFCKNGKKCTKNLSFLRKSRIFKTLSASGLALFMGIGTLCGVLLAPMNGSDAASMTSKTNLSAKEQAKAELDAQILAGDSLGLKPENDPVIYTTDYGLEIKYSNALTYLTGYTYFTAGGQNWVIIGYDSSMAAFVVDFNGETPLYHNTIQGNNSFINTVDNTPAGLAIKKEMTFISSAAVMNDEIGDGCVLCLCEKNITSTTTLNNYANSNLRSYINNTVYGGTSDLSLALQSLNIVPQTLTTLYYNSAISTLEDEYLFPLAGYGTNGENFYYKTYLPTNTHVNIGAYWWLRSGQTSYQYSSCCIAKSGGWYTHPESSNYGVRPAFVLKI